MNARVKPPEKAETISVTAPRLRVVTFKIQGTAPYVQHRFSEKARAKLMADMEAGSQSKKKKAKEPRDFDADARAALHVSSEGWIGIPAASFRAALISACRLVNFRMTFAKLSVFVIADGFDRVDGSPLVRIDGEWEKLILHVRNSTGVIDIRSRPMWREWSANVRVRFDEGQFSVTDVANLLLRAGMQVGIGEGRADSKQSVGLGYGSFDVVSQADG